MILLIELCSHSIVNNVFLSKLISLFLIDLKYKFESSFTNKYYDIFCILIEIWYLSMLDWMLIVLFIINFLINMYNLQFVFNQVYHGLKYTDHIFIYSVSMLLLVNQFSLTSFLDFVYYSILLEIYLKHHKISKDISYTKGKNKECIICYTESELVSLLSCNHQFHLDCIRKWTLHNYTCPICRKTIETQNNKYFIQ